MCGRYTLGESQNLFRRFHVSEDGLAVAERFNVAPSQHMPVIIGGASNQITLMQWGLIPSWSKDTKSSGGLINARVEGILDRPTFRTPIRKRRCLVPADGFYEWKKEEDLEHRVPYYIRRKDHQLFAFAGIYDVWHGPGGEVVEGYAVLTTRPNSLMEPIHKRMPVILEESAEPAWLDVQGADIHSLLVKLANPFPSEELEAFPISTKVNSPSLDFPGLLLPE